MTIGTEDLSRFSPGSMERNKLGSPGRSGSCLLCGTFWRMRILPREEAWRVHSASNSKPRIGALGDPSPRVVGEAITALGLIGPAAADAIPKLEKLAAMANRQIAGRAGAALRQIEESRKR